MDGGRPTLLSSLLLALLVALWPSPARTTPIPDEEFERELFGEDKQKETQPPVERLVLKGRPKEIEETSIDRPERAQVQLRGIEDAAALLESLSSVHITLNPLGERVLSIRGLRAAQVAVLVDGIPGVDPYSGIIDLASLPARGVQRIELIKGSAPILLPGGAMGGAVNIISRMPGSGPLVHGLLEYGANNSWRAGLEHSRVKGRLAYTVHGGFYHQDHTSLSRDFEATPSERPALRSASDRTSWHAGGSMHYRVTKEHAVKVRVSYLDGLRGVPPSTRAKQPDHRRLAVTRMAGVSVAHEGKVGRLELDEVIYARLYQRLLEVYDDQDLEQQVLPGSGDVWGHGVGVGGRLRGRTWASGLPWGLTFLRSALGIHHDHYQEEGALNGATPLPAADRTIISLGPEAESMLSPCWSVTIGVQLELEVPGEADASFGWGPLVSALYAPLDSVAVRGTVARRTRFPTLQERFSSMEGKRVPNPELRQENTWHMGLEATWRLLPGISLRGGVHDAEVLDVILPETTSGGLERLVNNAAARLVSVELGFTLSPFESLRLAATYSFLYARRTDDAAEDVQLPYRPVNKASMELVFAPWSFVEMATFLMVHGERFYPDPDSGGYGVLSPYAIWNARIAVRPVWWGSVFVRATNIMGTHHVTEYGFPDPGRRIWLGLDLKYDKS